jgi:cellulose synthase/poly-beta-1,6-N-acetylglucosamine synthase-like glycosyltransferase
MIFAASAAVLFAAGGMVIVAYIVRLRPWRESETAHSPSNHGVPVTIVVPVYNESSLIARKVADIRSLTYTNKRVLFIDGGSTDGTIELVPAEWLVQTQLRNKTAQINAAADLCDSEWILLTDADAALPREAVERLLGFADDSTGVVGARVMPNDAHPIESLHWTLSDRLRELESRRGSAGLVTAPCYLVRRRLIGELPSDTVADDVHIAFRSMAMGLRVVRAPVDVLELRSPCTVRDLLRHKFRKGDAYLREIFRFLPRARRMPTPMRAIFLWRTALLTIVPLLWTAAVLLLALAAPAAALIGVLVMFLLPPARPVALALLLAFISCAAIIAYPFSKQVASFPKIQTACDEVK